MGLAYRDYAFVARRTVVFDYEWRLKDGAQPVDLTGYTFVFRLRVDAGAPGDPILALGHAAHPADGFSFPAPGVTDGRIRLHIAQATLAGLPGSNQSEAGKPVTFAAELRGTHATKDPMVLGMTSNRNFILYPGA